jgi:hypothetical protein
MVEMARAGKDHGDTVFVGTVDDFVVFLWFAGFAS